MGIDAIGRTGQKCSIIFTGNDLQCRRILWFYYQDLIYHILQFFPKDINGKYIPKSHMVDICQKFGYSRSYLNKLFQSELGVTPLVYATYRKIEKSKALLRETPLNIAQIAAGLGFESPQYFSRVFKRCTGMTPTAYRNISMY